MISKIYYQIKTNIRKLRWGVNIVLKEDIEKYNKLTAETNDLKKGILKEIDDAFLTSKENNDIHGIGHEINLLKYGTGFEILLKPFGYMDAPKDLIEELKNEFQISRVTVSPEGRTDIKYTFRFD